MNAFDVFLSASMVAVYFAVGWLVAQTVYERASDFTKEWWMPNELIGAMIVFWPISVIALIFDFMGEACVGKREKPVSKGSGQMRPQA